MNLYNLKNNLINILGWRNKRKFIVFESDDWGSIGISSKSAYNDLLRKGYPLDQNVYNSKDILECNKDLVNLFEVLNSVRDKNDNPAKFTINNILGNPNFEKIKQNNYNKYYFENFTETYDKDSKRNRVLSLYFEGLRNNLIKNQFHGREHVHVKNWLEQLQKGNKAILDAFNNEMFTINLKRNTKCRETFLDSFAYHNKDQREFINNSIIQGLSLFENIWGYRSKTIISPCYVWNPEIEEVFKNCGIKTIQTSRVQRIPMGVKNKYKIVRKYTGQKNKNGLIYTIRNVKFEPSEDQNLDWVNTSLMQIKNSFLWKKPAIISTHRVNYVSGIDDKNAELSLIKLQSLLKKIVKIWPEAEFFSSDELSDLMIKNQ